MREHNQMCADVEICRIEPIQGERAAHVYLKIDGVDSVGKYVGQMCKFRHDPQTKIEVWNCADDTHDQLVRCNIEAYSRLPRLVIRVVDGEEIALPIHIPRIP